MASQHKIQAYMDKHRIESLFENLMNKVLRDLPEDPSVYLIRALYKKAGLDVPQEIRFGGMKKSTEFPRSQTPDRGRRVVMSVSADEGLSRSYDRPWQKSPSPNRRIKPKTDDMKIGKRPTGKHIDWNTDVKIKSTSFDDIWDDQSQPRKDVPIATRKRDPSPDKRTSWASIGFGNEKTNVFSSNNYSGPRNSRVLDDDPLTNELRPVTNTTVSSEGSRISSSHIKGPRVDAKKHRQELEKIIYKTDQSNDSGYEAEDKNSLSEEDEALELLEDAEDLRREGVRNIPKDGYKLSRISRQRHIEPKVKLNINPMVISRGKSSGYNIDDSDTDNRPQTGRHTTIESDEEFESISQVTGPREPVWKFRDAADSEAETYTMRVQSVSAHSGHHGYSARHTDKKNSMVATLPLRSSAQSGTDTLHKAGQTWTAGMEDERGGWDVPYDSDGSQTDLTQTTRSKPSRDPRVY